MNPKDNVAVPATKPAEPRPVAYQFRTPIFIGGGKQIGTSLDLNHERGIQVTEDDVRRRVWFRYDPGGAAVFTAYTPYENVIGAVYSAEKKA